MSAETKWEFYSATCFPARLRSIVVNARTEIKQMFVNTSLSVKLEKNSNY